jgi:glycine cleavage system H protein
MDTYTLPADTRYTASHLWVREEDGQAVVGLTEHGQERHGKILYVGLPAVGAPLGFGMPFGYLQSAAYGLVQLFPPVEGEVAAINDDLWARPTLINEDPLGDGWIIKVAMSRPDELADLDGPAEYRQILAGERRAAAVELPASVAAGSQPAFLIDDRRRILSCNAAAETLIGLWAREMSHGPLCQELFGCHEGPDQPITKGTCPGLCSMLNLTPVTKGYTVRNAGGGETRVEAEYTPLVQPGQPRRALVVLRLLD